MDNCWFIYVNTQKPCYQNMFNQGVNLSTLDTVTLSLLFLYNPLH